MKKHAIALLLAGLSCAASATWVQVSADTDTIGYYDPATRVRVGSVVTVAELSDFKRAATSATDRVFRSALIQRQYDCAAARARTVSQANFEDQMLAGRALDVQVLNGRWRAVVAGSTRAIALNVICLP